MSTKKMSELRGMAILTLEEGEEVGKVRDLLLDPAEMRVVAFMLDRRTAAREPQVVATANLHSIGKAAITIEDRGSLVPISRIPRFQELARTRSPLRGKAVISESGVQMGRIRDALLNLESFRLEALLLGGFPGRARRVLAVHVRTVGPDAVVVREGPLEVAPSPAVPVPGPEAAPAEVPLESVPPPAPVTVPEVPAVEMGLPPAPSEMATPLPDLTALPVPPPEGPPAPAGPGSPLPGEEPAPAVEAERPEPENPWQRWTRRLRRREERSE